jgi:integrase
MSIKLSIWIRPSQKNVENKTPIFLRIQFNMVRTEYSIGESVTIKEWDAKKQKMKGYSAQAEAVNGKIGAIKARTLKIYNELLLSGEPFNAHTVKDRLVNGLSKAITFDELMDEYLTKMKSLKGQSYSQPTIIKYRNTQLRVSQFVKKKYKRNYIFLYELDFDFIDGFETFLKTEFNNSNTTCKKHFDRISKIVRIALNKGYINRFPFTGYKIKLDKTPLVYLTYEEVQKIEAKRFDMDRLEHCRLLALLGCYSGLSFKEMANLEPKHIISSDGEVHWISMVRQKTKRPYRVVLLPQAYQLIQELQKYKKGSRDRSKLIPMFSNQKYNSYLKEIADLCGIPKKLTTHALRKTFTIGIALRQNVSIELISALLGHSSIRVTTDYYAKITDEIMIEGVKNLANQLEKFNSNPSNNSIE